MSHRAFVIGAGMAVLGFAPLGAQADPAAPATERAILQAVAEHEYERMERVRANAGRDIVVVFDYAVLPSGMLATGSADRGLTWPTAILDLFESFPGIRVGTLKEHHTCPEDGPPGYCLLEGADVVVSFGRPELNGETGKISVRRIGRASADIDSPRAYMSGAGLKIARVDGEWQVVGVDYVIVSD